MTRELVGRTAPEAVSVPKQPVNGRWQLPAAIRYVFLRGNGPQALSIDRFFPGFIK
ncbi:hypothetical protein [Salibacterium qingdaonense]|uniref:hypothetical protein n=1 Tax=Salibacterium qingdaonense TaxID=266892 RepID=UPI0015A61DF3|nr:hypothetical protein [Salibacterium qingdaonense]